MSEEQNRTTLVRTFWAAVGAALILGWIPFGNFVLYPFALLGTWAHEMGHGLAAVVAGGSFEHLELYSNLGGVAFYELARDASASHAFVAAAGLIAPAIAGGTVIALGSRKRTAKWVMDVLGVLLLLSAVLFVRNVFGFAATVVLGGASFAVGRWSNELLELAVTQFVGVRLSLESLSSVDYMFTKSFQRGGDLMSSDTQQIAEHLGFTYWFWGAMIAGICVTIVGSAYYLAWGPESNG